jgi:aminoglycoside phosphotransferase (APT) family kinase protein
MMDLMVPGAPAEARWVRAAPRLDWPLAVVERMVRTAFPRHRVLECRPLSNGLRNANLLLTLDSVAEPLVLRIYQHDPSLCQKEVDLMRLVRPTVPVPEVIHASPRGWEELPPFALLQFVEGISLLDLKRRGDLEAFAQAAFSAGETLAAIGRFRFPKAGWLGPGPAVTAPLLEGADPLPRFVDLCLAAPNLERRVPAELRDRIHKLVWPWAARLASLDADPRLVHGDFNRRNLVARQVAGRWAVVAVLDWEFAIASSPLADIENFLRYELDAHPLAEPHFSTGFTQAGGALPEDWRRVGRLVGLTATCESLTHDDLPEDIATELVELVRATVENREPRMSSPTGLA